MSDFYTSGALIGLGQAMHEERTDRERRQQEQELMAQRDQENRFNWVLDNMKTMAQDPRATPEASSMAAKQMLRLASLGPRKTKEKDWMDAWNQVSQAATAGRMQHQLGVRQTTKDAVGKVTDEQVAAPYEHIAELLSNTPLPGAVPDEINSAVQAGFKGMKEQGTPALRQSMQSEIGQAVDQKYPTENLSDSPYYTPEEMNQMKLQMMEQEEAMKRQIAAKYPQWKTESVAEGAKLVTYDPNDPTGTSKVIAEGSPKKDMNRTALDVYMDPATSPEDRAFAKQLLQAGAGGKGLDPSPEQIVDFAARLSRHEMTIESVKASGINPLPVLDYMRTNNIKLGTEKEAEQGAAVDKALDVFEATATEFEKFQANQVHPFEGGVGGFVDAVTSPMQTFAKTKAAAAAYAQFTINATVSSRLVGRALGEVGVFTDQDAAAYKALMNPGLLSLALFGSGFTAQRIATTRKLLQAAKAQSERNKILISQGQQPQPLNLDQVLTRGELQELTGAARSAMVSAPQQMRDTLISDKTLPWNQPGYQPGMPQVQTQPTQAPAGAGQNVNTAVPPAGATDPNAKFDAVAAATGATPPATTPNTPNMIPPSARPRHGASGGWGDEPFDLKKSQQELQQSQQPSKAINGRFSLHEVTSPSVTVPPPLQGSNTNPNINPVNYNPNAPTQPQPQFTDQEVFRYDPQARTKIPPEDVKALYQNLNISVDQLDEVARKYNMNAAFLVALAKQESSLTNKPPNSEGAFGPTQFQMPTAKEYGVDPNNMLSFFEGTARYLRDLRRRFGSTDAALMAYIAGPGNYARGEKLGPETRSYAKKIRSRMSSGI